MFRLCNEDFYQKELIHTSALLPRKDPSSILDLFCNESQTAILNFLHKHKNTDLLIALMKHKKGKLIAKYYLAAFPEDVDFLNFIDLKYLINNGHADGVIALFDTGIEMGGAICDTMLNRHAAKLQLEQIVSEYRYANLNFFTLFMSHEAFYHYFQNENLDYYRINNLIEGGVTPLHLKDYPWIMRHTKEYHIVNAFLDLKNYTNFLRHAIYHYPLLLRISDSSTPLALKLYQLAGTKLHLKSDELYRDPSVPLLFKIDLDCYLLSSSEIKNFDGLSEQESNMLRVFIRSVLESTTKDILERFKEHLSKNDLTIFLIYAVLLRHNHLVNQMLDLGADPAAQVTLYGKSWTAAHYAVDLEYLDTLDILLRARPVFAPDSHGVTALDLAANKKYPHTLTAILKRDDVELESAQLDKIVANKQSAATVRTTIEQYKERGAQRAIAAGKEVKLDKGRSKAYDYVLIAAAHGQVHLLATLITPVKNGGYGLTLITPHMKDQGPVQVAYSHRQFNLIRELINPENQFIDMLTLTEIEFGMKLITTSKALFLSCFTHVFSKLLQNQNFERAVRWAQKNMFHVPECQHELQQALLDMCRQFIHHQIKFHTNANDLHTELDTMISLLASSGIILKSEATLVLADVYASTNHWIDAYVWYRSIYDNQTGLEHEKAGIKLAALIMSGDVMLNLENGHIDLEHTEKNAALTTDQRSIHDAKTRAIMAYEYIQNTTLEEARLLQSEINQSLSDSDDPAFWAADSLWEFKQYYCTIRKKPELTQSRQFVDSSHHALEVSARVKRGSTQNAGFKFACTKIADNQPHTHSPHKSAM